MKHYDGPAFLRQHPEELTRIKQHRHHILHTPMATEQQSSSSQRVTEGRQETSPVNGSQDRTPTSAPVRFGNDEVQIDRATASMYASQQARALEQTIRPRRRPWQPKPKSAARDTQYVSALNKPFAPASAAYSATSDKTTSSWGKDDWSHKTEDASTSSNLATTSAKREPSNSASSTEVVARQDSGQSSNSAASAHPTVSETSVQVTNAVSLTQTSHQDDSYEAKSIQHSDSSAALQESIASSKEHSAQSMANVTSHATDSDMVATSSPAARSQTALGHGLADILNEEQNGQKDLALFNHDHADSDKTMDGSDQRPISENAQAKTSMQTVEQTVAPLSGRTYASESDKGLMTYHFPSLDLLKPPVLRDEAKLDAWIEKQIDVLNSTLSAFNVDGEVVDYTVGPTVTQFQVSLGPGVRVNKITNLQDDLKLALAAKDIRIEAPIPGQSTVGIEIPDLKSRPVMLSEVLRSDVFQNSLSPLTVALGVDLFGKPQVTDLRSMPHGLIAGATGSGKSVFINSLLMSIMYKATPQEVKLILIDPKAVEMAPYNGIPHLLSPVVSEPQAAAAALKWAVNEMEERYQKLAAGGARNIEQFNEKAVASGHPEQKMPYIVIIIDELADLMMVAASEVQDYIARITQKARAAGLHLLVATQRPSVDVVTGTIKNNIPTRVAFMVSSQVDSRTILDTAGAERLLGRGDMLYLGNGKSQPIRLQGTFVDDEIDTVTDFVREQMAPHYAFEPKQLLATEIAAEDQDDLWPDVLSYVANEKTVSTSKLQRVFSIGYNRAANLVDQLESHSYVSAQQGSKPREVFLTPDKLKKSDED